MQGKKIGTLYEGDIVMVWEARDVTSFDTFLRISRGERRWIKKDLCHGYELKLRMVGLIGFDLSD